MGFIHATFEYLLDWSKVRWPCLPDGGIEAGVRHVPVHRTWFKSAGVETMTGMQDSPQPPVPASGSWVSDGETAFGKSWSLWLGTSRWTPPDGETRH